ncbi:MAG: hypothetical protein MR966_13795 [Lachnospiraceae bacterium]|nr:hypothetical protein [Lachnospiraceae bacterium]
MINNDKVRLMTKIQLFENHEQDALKADRFFQRDYLGLHMIRSLLAYIVLFILVLAVVFLYNWEELLTGIDLTALIHVGRWIILSFFLLLIPSMIVSYIVYWFQYRRYRRKVRDYVMNLKQLNTYYKEETNQTAE